MVLNINNNDNETVVRNMSRRCDVYNTLVAGNTLK